MRQDPNNAAPPWSAARTLAELMAFADQEFVICAYWTILGREADPEGIAHYTARLRLGDHRMRIAATLRRSGEGRIRPEPVRGLDRAIRQDALCRLPVIGSLLAFVIGAESNSRRARRHRRVENVLWRISADLASSGATGGLARSSGLGLLRSGPGNNNAGIANAYVRSIARDLTGQ